MRNDTALSVRGQTASQATSTPSDNGQVPGIFELNRAIRRKESGLTAQERLVLLEIVDRAGNASGVCKWSTEKIASFLGIDPRHGRRIVTKLAADCYIEIIRHGESKFASKAMRIGPKLLDLARTHGKLEPKSASAPGHPEPGADKVHPDTQSRVQTKCTRTFGAVHPDISCTAPGHPEPVHPDTQSRETSLERLHETSSVVNSREETTTTIATRGEEDESKSQQGSLDDVCDTIKRCTHIPNDWADKLRASTDLPYRIKGDWYSLLLAVTRLDDKIRAKDVKLKSIDSPVNYLIGMVREIPELPPGEIEDLKQKAQRAHDTASQEAAERGPGSFEQDFRQKVRDWYSTMKGKAVPDPEILPRMFDYIDSVGAANRYSDRMIEYRKSLAENEVQRLALAAAGKAVQP